MSTFLSPKGLTELNHYKSSNSSNATISRERFCALFVLARFAEHFVLKLLFSVISPIFALVNSKKSYRKFDNVHSFNPAAEQARAKL